MRDNLGRLFDQSLILIKLLGLCLDRSRQLLCTFRELILSLLEEIVDVFLQTAAVVGSLRGYRVSTKQLLFLVHYHLDEFLGSFRLLFRLMSTQILFRVVDHCDIRLHR